MEDLPAKREQALADSGTPPASSGSVNMWCLQFDDGANLPAPGQDLPKRVDLRATSTQPRVEVGGGGAGAAGAAGAAGGAATGGKAR
jgi:hypothetical protein